MSPARTRRPAGLTARAHRPVLTAATALAVVASSLAGALPASAASGPTTGPTAVAEEVPVDAGTVLDGPVAVAEDPADEPAPAAVVAPPAEHLHVDGVLATGGTVTVDPAADEWAPAGTTLTFAWFLADATGPTGTGQQLVLGPETCGAALAVEVTGTSPGATPATVRVAADAPVAPCAGTVTVTGSARVGSTLTAVTAGWPQDAVLTHEWLRGEDVVGTQSTYAVTAADLGAPLAVRVTATTDGHDPVSGTSEPTAPVTVGSLTTAVPALSGSVRVGSKVTAKPGTWTPGTVLAYQWRVDGASVAGATSSTFTPTSAHRGKALSVVVTGTLDGYATAKKASPATTVGSGVLSAPVPTISGKVRVGSKVSVVRGAWSPAASYRYQWRANGAAIKGATSSSYTIPASLRGKKLSVTVTGSKTGYTTKAVTSAATSVTATFTTAPTPKITGTARIGSTLKVTAGTWKPAPTLSYQWRRNGTAVPGATRSSYKLTTADHGTTITVTVTARRSTYVTTTRTSRATAKVAGPAPTLSKNGTFKVGTTIAPGTYVSSTTASWCSWQLRTNTGTGDSGLRGWNWGSGRHIVTITSADKYFRTSGCGTWTRRVSVGATLTTTAANGMYAIGTRPGDLRPGTYETSGGVDGGECYIAALGDFTGSDDSIVDSASGHVGPDVPEVIVLDTSVAGFHTQNCVWIRVSD